MPKLSSHHNIIYLNFFDKKPLGKGVWSNEPDYMLWSKHDLMCFALRNMKNGAWHGYVGVLKGHAAFNKDIPSLMEEKWFQRLSMIEMLANGRSLIVGKLPKQYDQINDQLWWIGFACDSAADLLPIDTDDKREKIKGKQIYCSFKIVRQAINKLAKELSEVAKP